MDTAPRVLTLVGSKDASSMYRVFQPAAALEAQGYIAHWAYNQDDGLALATARYGYSVIALDRLSWSPEELPVARHFIDTMHRQGRAVVYLCDDDAWLAIDEHLTDLVDQERLQRNKHSLATLRLCDGVIVSTQRLKTVVSTLTDAPCAVVPNLIDLAWFRAVQAKAVRAVPPLTIGWAGAKRQEADVLSVAEAWSRIARRLPGVRFVVQGHAPDALTSAVPTDRLHRLPWMAIEEYPLGLVNVDIGCASVADNRFNRSKSIIKCLEYGSRGKTAVVATPTLYREIVKDGDTGLLAETADEWEAALTRLIEDRLLRRALARRLGRKVEADYDLARHCERWVGAYSWLLDQVRGRVAA